MSGKAYLDRLSVVNERFRHLVNSSRFHLGPLARELGVLSGHSNYSKFIILGRGRSGSNFLRGSLNSHSQTIVFGELFRFPGSIGWEFPDHEQYLQSNSLISLAQSDPAKFLEKKVFRKYPKHILAVGFKLFYYHAQEDSRKAVWTFLKNRQDIKVIHLKRNNTLKVLLSEKKAFKTNRWTNMNGEQEDKFVLPLEYEECLSFFNQAREERDQFDIFFRNHDKLEVIYEDLVHDYGGEMKRIQEFLGTDYEVVQPRTYKQSNTPLTEAISNYLELKEKFKASPWEAFFED